MSWSPFQNRWGMRLGVFGILLLVLFVLQRWQIPSQPKPSVTSPVFLPQMHETWRQQVQLILEQYDQDKNAKAAQEQLLALKVTREDQSKHLALVLALNALASGEADGSIRLRAAREQLIQP